MCYCCCHCCCCYCYRHVVELKWYMSCHVTPYHYSGTSTSRSDHFGRTIHDTKRTRAHRRSSGPPGGPLAHQRRVPYSGYTPRVSVLLSVVVLCRYTANSRRRCVPGRKNASGKYPVCCRPMKKRDAKNTATFYHMTPSIEYFFVSFFIQVPQNRTFGRNLYNILRRAFFANTLINRIYR